ncbi:MULTISPECIES: DUF3500 domain-containing protein [unclassified Vibrio]|uniref:DUF3500 domain-containing protein n=1 Tax=Vibrio sp. HB236076 TaxID=3232307 RepID=A0AB39HH18_9VIBR|nr:DUF3500 domain-containing protein [Vibrio sp. HB161653]MDP5254479.1 DUF3500 domain-containing protein [Vibrio sp. HB161653]
MSFHVSFSTKPLLLGVLAVGAVSLAALSFADQESSQSEEIVAGQEQSLPNGPGASDHQGPPPGPPPSAEDEAVRARMGDTSTLMGTISIPDTVKTCGTDAGYERLVCLTNVLKETLSDEQLALTQLDYSIEKAKTWSNLPAGAVPSRPGIFLGELSVKQRGIVKAIMMEATGSDTNEGFDEMVQTLNADDYIGTISTDYKAGYSSFNTKFAFLGDPSSDEVWQLYYGGHHLAFTNTYKNGHMIGATPSFRGIEPFPAFDMNGRTNIPMQQERDAFAAMLNSLSQDQRQQAKLAGVYRDILAGPQEDDAIPETQEGVSVSQLNDEQKALVMAAIETYVGDIDEADANAYMEKYRSELDDTTIGYSGTVEMNSEDDYVRIHGPSVWIEFSLQSNKSTNKVGIHPHSVWRDRTDDYGGQQ